MSLKKVRDIVFIICAILFVLAYSISNLLPIFSPSWYYQQSSTYLSEIPPNVFADCQSNNNTHTLTVSISNPGQNKLEDVKCNLIDKSGLTSPQDSQTILSLGSQSTDICTFELEGLYKKPLRLEVIYGEKSLKLAVQCYPVYDG